MKRGQIWIETVIYTLIGLALIGIVLAVTMPKINEFKDRATIEQTIDALNTFNSRVHEVLSAPGNVRKIELKMKRGNFYVKGLSDEIVYELEEVGEKYSEPDVSISSGNVNILTETFGSDYKVTLSLNYSIYNITYQGLDEDEKFSGVSLPYEFIIENKGVRPDSRTQIDIRLG